MKIGDRVEWAGASYMNKRYTGTAVTGAGDLVWVLWDQTVGGPTSHYPDDIRPLCVLDRIVEALDK